MTREEILTNVELIIANGNYSIEHLLNAVPKELVPDVARMIKSDLENRKQKTNVIDRRR